MQKKKFDLTSDIVEVKLEENELKKPIGVSDSKNKKNVLLTIVDAFSLGSVELLVKMFQSLVNYFLLWAFGKNPFYLE